MYQNALNRSTGIYLPTFRVVAYLQGELNPGRPYIIASTLEVKNTISCSAAYYCSPALYCANSIKTTIELSLAYIPMIFLII